MPSCAAWGETSLISTDWDLKHMFEIVDKGIHDASKNAEKTEMA